ncbi:mediator of RNA polymerase II transcription subunit 32-like [Zingiber officinale]|uniref:Uncharacterized protein n=1 Tax=Zingiber officinale TaxID=94328 RepID=A0A8J5GTJ8_ZINOF|nr:mediator of RNA polymerase II transcription subunit 32-like [Zingiber officinale]KAG6512512.1 hypothetical protein ZIOFF_030633 [Zingiber officinale]
MDTTIEAMSREYEELVAAAMEVVEQSGGRSGTGLEKFKQRWQLFMASCDKAEGMVELARRRITADHVMDMASGMAPGGLVELPLPHISIPHLEQVIHTVNSLTGNLQQGPLPVHKVD